LGYLDATPGLFIAYAPLLWLAVLLGAGGPEAQKAD
jgi:hypothetical protein